MLGSKDSVCNACDPHATRMCTNRPHYAKVAYTTTKLWVVGKRTLNGYVIILMHQS